MTRPRDFDRLLGDWLEEAPPRTPDEILTTVAAALPSIPQRGARRIPWRLQPMFGLSGPGKLAAASVVVVLAAVGFVALYEGQLPSIGGGAAGSVSGGATPSSTPSPSPSPRFLFPATPKPADPLVAAGWTTYQSRYGFPIGVPPGWTVRPAQRAWSSETDATDARSPGMEQLISPDGQVRVSAWLVPFDAGTETDPIDFDAWVEAYCQKTQDAPCTGIRQRAVPLCLEARDCHPGLLVPFATEVQAFFTGGIYDGGGIIVVSVWSGERDPAVTAYGGAKHLLEAFLSTMSVWPESVPGGDRVVRPAPSAPPP